MIPARPLRAGIGLALAALGFGGCEVVPTEPPPGRVGISVGELVAGGAVVGTVATIGPLAVTSPRTRDGRSFYAADPGGGAHSGLRVDLGAVIEDWPPPAGTPFTLTGIVVSTDPAVMFARNEADFVREGPNAPVPPAEPRGGAAQLEQALVVLRGLTVTSAPDPLGNADTDGAFAIGGRFAVAPGYGRTGDLVGILVDGRVSARYVTDWSGTYAGVPPRTVGQTELAALADGTPVVLDALTVATPWSRDRRWAVLQDAAGAGIWVDAEGWGLWASTGPGTRGRWTGEVRRDADGVYLRAWDPPVLTDTAEPAIAAADGAASATDGALVRIAVTGIGPSNAFGERAADGLVLDDRFVPLDGLGDSATVVGAWRGAADSPSSAGPTLAVTAIE